MPIFEFEKPDGSIVEVDAPTQEAALAGFQRQSKPGFTDKLGVKNFGIAAADVALSAGNQTLHQLAGTVRGLSNLLPAGTDGSYAEGRALVRDREGDLGPRTGAGRELADKVGQGMRVTGIPQLMEWAGKKLDEHASPEVADAVRTGATVASLGVPASRAARVARPSVTAPARAVEAVQNDGYLVSPHRPVGPEGAVAGDTSSNVRSALSSHSVNDAKLAIANQDVTQRWAARANEIDGEISPESIQAAIKRSEEPYQELRDANLAVFQDQQFLQDVAGMTGNQGTVGVRLAPDAAVERVQTALLSASRQSTASIIDDVRAFRSKGYKQLNSQDAATQDVGSANLAAADALDGLLDRSLQRAAQMADRAAPTEAALYRRLHAAYTEGRRRRADLHILEEAANGATGEVDAAVIAKIGERRRLNDHYARIARAYQVAPNAMQRVDRASRTARQSSVTMAPSTISGTGSMLARMVSRRTGAAAPRRGAPRGRSAARYAPGVGAAGLNMDNSGGGR
jgi:hypothetical protein